MSEALEDLFEKVSSITSRNLCAAGCGGEHSPAGKPPGVMIPDIGIVCAGCTPEGIAVLIEAYPKKSMPIPFYRAENP